MKSIKMWLQTLLVIALFAGSESSFAARVTVGLNAGEAMTLVSNGPVSIQARCVSTLDGNQLEASAVTTTEDSYAPFLFLNGGPDSDDFLQPDTPYNDRLYVLSRGSMSSKFNADAALTGFFVASSTGHVVELKSVISAVNQSYSTFDCILNVEVEKHSIAKPKKPKLLPN